MRGSAVLRREVQGYQNALEYAHASHVCSRHAEKDSGMSLAEQRRLSPCTYPESFGTLPRAVGSAPSPPVRTRKLSLRQEISS